MKIGEKGMMHDVFLSAGDKPSDWVKRLRQAGVQVAGDVEEKIVARPYYRRSLYEVVLFDGHSFHRSHLSYQLLAFESRRQLCGNICLEAACLLFISLKADFMESFNFQTVLAFHDPFIEEGKSEQLALIYENGIFILRTVLLPDYSGQSKCWAYAFQRI
ncbi:MAG: hypothetical protein ACM3PZ_02160 [Bacillota bacterium]